MQISKSEYMMSLKHPAWLWLKKHRPDVLPKPSPALQARFDEGNDFERYALKLFPDIVELGFKDFTEYRSLTQRTREALESRAPAVAQGRFEAGPITCIVDLLQRTDAGRFNLIEIKSSTKVKDQHIYDLAFQRAVLEDAGVPLDQLFVYHVDSFYRRQGDIEPQQLVGRVRVTDEVAEKMDFTRRAISRATRIAEAHEMPDPSPRHARLRSYQEWLEIYQSLAGALPENSIYLLPYVNAERINELLDAGVTTVEQIKDLTGISASQLRYVEALRSGERYVDQEGVRAFLSSLTYPLYFLDYETSASLVPPFDGLKPYQQLPFQYSLHIQREPGGEIEHLEYLHEDATNPAPALLERLSKDIDYEGSVVVWYAPFETGRNRELAELYPSHSVFLEQLNARVIDLMDPFKDGLIVDPGFRGSASIKKVLPVLAPDLSYGVLEIQEGETASRLWKEATLEGQHQEQRTAIYRDLREYCRLDTWAMVRIFQELMRLAEADD